MPFSAEYMHPSSLISYLISLPESSRLLFLSQFDIHQPFTTVKEALQFSAWLRFGTDTSSETMEQFITEVMALVELDSLEKALVGRPGQSGLSVEQRKRLTIAVELVANPSIVFMDEPTSGVPLFLIYMAPLSLHCLRKNGLCLKAGRIARFNFMLEGS